MALGYKLHPRREEQTKAMAIFLLSKIETPQNHKPRMEEIGEVIEIHGVEEDDRGVEGKTFLTTKKKRCENHGEIQIHRQRRKVMVTMASIAEKECGTLM